MQKAHTKIGLATAVAIVVANMVGTGVFGSLGFQVAGIPSGFPILMLWLVGGIVSFCGAVCYAEVAAMFPRSGGEYHLLSESLNPFIGFLAGWISVTVGFAAPIALNATLLGKYLGNIFETSPFFFSIPVVLLVGIIHLGRLANIERFQLAFTYSKVTLILILGALGFFIGKAQPVSFLPVAGDGDLIMSGSFAISLVYVFYAYTGWNAATYMIDELKNPKRNVPLALLIGTGIVTLLYLLLNASFFYATPIADMKNQPEVGLIAAKAILGPRGGMIMGILISFGLISTISSMTWAGPRVTSAMGRDHREFRFFNRLNRNGVPALAILLQTAVVILLISTATFQQLIHYVMALLTISSIMVVIGLVWLRIKAPNADRPYRAWGFPITPIIFFTVSGYVLVFQIRDKTEEFFCGLATLALGALLYWVMKKQQKDSKTR